jgi:putative aminopeptidase FrvX
MKRVKETYSLEIDVLGIERVKVSLTKEEFFKQLEKCESVCVDKNEVYTEGLLIRHNPQIAETKKMIYRRYLYSQGTTDIYLIHRTAKEGYTLIKPT